MLKNKVDGIIGLLTQILIVTFLPSLPFVSFDRHFSEKCMLCDSENYIGD